MVQNTELVKRLLVDYGNAWFTQFMIFDLYEKTRNQEVLKRLLKPVSSFFEYFEGSEIEQHVREIIDPNLPTVRKFNKASKLYNLLLKREKPQYERLERIIEIVRNTLRSVYA